MQKNKLHIGRSKRHVLAHFQRTASTATSRQHIHKVGPKFVPNAGSTQLYKAKTHADLDAKKRNAHYGAEVVKMLRREKGTRKVDDPQARLDAKAKRRAERQMVDQAIQSKNQSKPRTKVPKRLRRGKVRSDYPTVVRTVRRSKPRAAKPSAG